MCIFDIEPQNVVVFLRPRMTSKLGVALQPIMPKMLSTKKKRENCRIVLVLHRSITVNGLCGLVNETGEPFRVDLLTKKV